MRCLPSIPRRPCLPQHTSHAGRVIGPMWSELVVQPCCASAPILQAAMGALCDLVKAANIYLAARQDAAGGLLNTSWSRFVVPCA